MLPVVITVEVIKDYDIKLVFHDGTEGVVDIAQLVPFEGVFQPLKDLSYFNTVTVNADLGTICWDNGADIAPETLYQAVQS